MGYTKISQSVQHGTRSYFFIVKLLLPHILFITFSNPGLGIRQNLRNCEIRNCKTDVIAPVTGSILEEWRIIIYLWGME